MELFVPAFSALANPSGPVTLDPGTAVASASVAAIIVLVVFAAFLVFVALAWRRKSRLGSDDEKPSIAAPKTPPAKLPASKEVFAPLPSTPAAKPSAPAKVAASKPAPSEVDDDDDEPVDSAWELEGEGDGDEAKAATERNEAKEREARKREAAESEARARAEAQAREAEAKRVEAEKKKAEADLKAKQAEAKKAEAARAEEDAKKALVGDDEGAKKAIEVASAEARRRAAEAEEAEKAAKAAAEAQKAAEHEAKAEAARAAEARDRATKEAAERAKAEQKAKAEAEAKQKAEQRRKEAEQKAKLEAEAKAKAEAEAEKAKPKKGEDDGPAKTLRDGLGRTRKEGFIAKLTSLFAGKQIDQDLLDEVEETLFTADIGAKTAERLLGAVREALSKKELKDANKVWEVLRNEAQRILEGATAGAKVGVPKPGEPFVTMVLGVNGTGKTTSIGKLSHKLLADGKKVVLVAGDTFRAAAAEQLEHWARRVGVPCIKGKDGADPASVVFDGVKQAVADQAEFVLVDTAGRLHNNTNLMEELKKVRRVMGRAIEGAPHEVLLVLDATTGQNAITQAKLFKEATDVTGIILTKLDGTAKGGVVLGVCDEMKIPIRWIGVGERVADLRVFDPKEFVDELFQPPT